MSNLLLKRYGIYCQNESGIQYTWDTNGITQCPNNASHSVSGDCQIYDSVSAISITPLASPYLYNNKSIIADTSTGGITINMVKASKQANKVVIIKKLGATNTLTVSANSGDNINGVTNYIATGTIFLQSDGISMWKGYSDVFQNPDAIGIYNPSNNKGDIFVDSGYDTTRLVTTRNNAVLTVDSTSVNGITWKDPSMCMFSSCFATSNSQMYVAISTTADTIVAYIPIRANQVPTTLLVAAALNSSSSATGTIILKEFATLTTLSTITVNSGTTTVTRYIATIPATTQNLLVLTARTTNVLVSINVYSVAVL